MEPPLMGPYGPHRAWVAVCNRCSAHGPAANTEAEAIAIWNRRAVAAMAEQHPPKRACRFVLDLQADTRQDLADALYNMASSIERGEMTKGVSGGYSSGFTYELVENERPTHDEYVQQLNGYLQAQKDGTLAASQSDKVEVPIELARAMEGPRAAPAPIPKVDLAFFTELRSIIADTNQPLGNRLQMVDARIALLTGAPQPDPGIFRQPREIERDSLSLEQLIHRDVLQLTQLAAAAGLVFTVRRDHSRCLSMAGADYVVDVYPLREASAKKESPLPNPAHGAPKPPGHNPVA
jgi:hypothetical protein